MPKLLANIELTTGQSAPGAFADVLGMSAVVNVASVDSIILLIASVPIAADIDTTNRAALFRFAVGGVLEGPEVSAEVDNIDEGSGLAGFHYALTGLSGSQTFSLQWLNFADGTATLDTGKVRNFQVIELLPDDTAAILANVQSTAAGADSTGSFADVPLMTAGITVGAIDRLILMACTVPIDASDSADETAAFRFADGGVLEGPEVLVFKDGVDQGMGLNALLLAKLGISGAKTFSCQWATEGGAGALSLDTARTRGLQILEVTPQVQGGSSLLANVETVSSGSVSSSTFEDVPGLTTGSLAFGGTGKKLIFLANLIQATLDSIDAVAEFQYAVDGIREGPRVRTYKDAIDRADTLSGFMWTRPGLIGNHTVTLQWRAIGGTPVLDTTRERNLQVIEVNA